MKVFVWKNYGEISVIELSCAEDYRDLFESIEEIIKQWDCYGAEIAYAITMVKDLDDKLHWKAASNYLLETCCEDSENFEHGTGFYETEKP